MFSPWKIWDSGVLLKSLEFFNKWDFRMVSAWVKDIAIFSCACHSKTLRGEGCKASKFQRPISIDFVTNLLLEIPDSKTISKTS